MTGNTSGMLATSRRQFRQADLNSLIDFAMGELSKYGMAWRAVVQRDERGRGQEELVTARVSPSRVSRKARELLSVFSAEAARSRMAQWVGEVAGDEYVSYRRGRGIS